MGNKSSISEIDQKSEINCHDLPLGMTLCGDQPVRGFKYFVDCEVKQTFLERITAKHTVYSHCYAMVTVPTNGKVVRPIDTDFSYYDDQAVKSHDIRSDKLIIGDIFTPGGKKCMSARSPFRRMVYHPMTEYLSVLDLNYGNECREGLHFYTSQKVMESKSPICIGEESSKIEWFGNFPDPLSAHN